MGTTAEKLQALFNSKNAIKQAIINKGGSVGDKMSEYASAIEGLETGSTGITPTGTITIEKNNTYDVTNYASASVNVKGTPHQLTQAQMETFLGTPKCQSGDIVLNTDTNEYYKITGGQGEEFGYEKLSGTTGGSENNGVDWNSASGEIVPATYTLYYYYIAKNGVDMYYSSNSNTDLGIWHMNLETGENTKIYNYGYRLANFFEDSKGNIYASCVNNPNSGIYYFKGNTVKKIYGSGQGWDIIYETKNGNVYIVSKNNTSAFGIIHLDGENATNIYTERNEYGWNQIYEDSIGNLYFSSNSCLVKVNNDVATELHYSIGFGELKYRLECSNGDLYFCTGSKIIYIQNNVATSYSLTNGYMMYYFFEDSKGNVYLGSESTRGIFKLNGTTYEQLSTSGQSIRFFEDSKGYIYTTADNANGGQGISCIKDGTVTTIYSSDYNYYFYEDSKGDVYACGRSGVYYIDNELNVTRTHRNGIYKYFFEKNDETYISNNEKAINGSVIAKLNKSNNVTLHIYLED